MWLILLPALSPQLGSLRSTSELYTSFLHHLSLCYVLFGVIPPPVFIFYSVHFTFCAHFPVFPAPHKASCVHCVWAPVSGPPVFWARWSSLLWEALWHGERIKYWSWYWFLQSVLHPAWLQSPSILTRVTRIVHQLMSVQQFGHEYDQQAGLIHTFILMPDHILNRVSSNKFQNQLLFILLKYNYMLCPQISEIFGWWGSLKSLIVI